MPGHPHFPSPQAWLTRLDEALAEAQKSGRRVFVQLGAPDCAASRALVEKTVAKDEILEYLGGHYVCVAQAAGAPEPSVEALVAQMPSRTKTPYCLYLAADGRLLHATSGGRPPAVFLTDLIQASAL